MKIQSFGDLVYSFEKMVDFIQREKETSLCREKLVDLLSQAHYWATQVAQSRSIAEENTRYESSYPGGQIPE